MNDYKMRRRIAIVFVAISIGLPLVVMFWYPGAGALFLLMGALAAYRAIRFLSHNEEDVYARFRRVETAGKTILVQIVDDYGRPLSPLEADRRIQSARAKAGPRDTVVPVKFRVENKVEILDKQSRQNS